MKPSASTGLKICHETKYTFESDVFLEPHLLRLKPKTSRKVSLSSFRTEVSPSPMGRSEITDVENNNIQVLWFEDVHRELIISTESILVIKEVNPFDFLIYPEGYNHIPFQYGELDSNLLRSALKSEYDLSMMSQFIEDAGMNSGHNTIQFISILTQKIHSDFILESRETGSPLEPSATFRSKKGSCRDLSWMLIHMLRQSGLASRFVSGYFYISQADLLPELHAWVEVYIPGAGWIGFDPSHGIVAGTYHIPIVSSAFFENTMPVTGSIRGDSGGSLSTHLSIERSEADQSG